MSLHYLDAAATSPLRPEARNAMLEALDAGAGNASSVHSAGHRARSIVEDARETIAGVLGAHPSEVVFTSGGTEANNLAVLGLSLGAVFANPRARHIVTTPIEHPSVIESCRFLERVHGFEVSELPVDGAGLVSAADAAVVLREDTALVTIGLANGEVGTVQPLAEIAEAIAGRGALLHTDAVQAVASLPVSFGGSVDEFGGFAGSGWPGARFDAMSIASHKFGGPQGVGALLLRRGVSIEPLLHGGGQEGGLRSGTENVAGIAGFSAAVAATAGSIGTLALELSMSRDALVKRVLGAVRGARLIGHPSERLPGHASFVIEGVSGESLLVALDAAGVAVSSGSACAAGKDEPSPTLLAMGIDPLLAQTAIRFSLPAPISSELIDRIVAVLVREVDVASRMRR